MWRFYIIVIIETTKLKAPGKQSDIEQYRHSPHNAMLQPSTGQ